MVNNLLNQGAQFIERVKMSKGEYINTGKVEKSIRPISTMTKNYYKRSLIHIVSMIIKFMKLKIERKYTPKILKDNSFLQVINCICTST